MRRRILTILPYAAQNEGPGSDSHRVFSRVDPIQSDLTPNPENVFPAANEVNFELQYGSEVYQKARVTASLS
jgi:hypothetical protein